MPARFGTLSGFRSGRGRPLGLILRRGWGGVRICRMKGLRWDIRANPMLLDVAPRGTPEICMISILVLSFCPVCHLLFVHSRGKKFRLARKKKKGAVLRRKGFRARRSVLFSLHSFFRSPFMFMLIQKVAYWSIVIDCGLVEPQDVFKTGKCPYRQLPLFYK